MRLHTWRPRAYTVLYSLSPRTRISEDRRQSYAHRVLGQNRCSGLPNTHAWLAIDGLPSQCSLCGAAV